MKVLLYSFLLCIPFSLPLQGQNPVIDSLVSKLDAYDQMDHPRIGIGGQLSSQYNRFEELTQRATAQELLDLLEHENPVIQGYASWGLIQKKYKNLDNVFSYFGDSGLTVKTQSGCLVMTESLLHEFYFKLYQEVHYGKHKGQDKSILRAQLSKIDSAILFDRIKGNIRPTWDKSSSIRPQDSVFLKRQFPVVDKYLLTQVLQNNKAHPGRYEPVRKWALEKGNEDALIPLALYQKKSDIEALKALGPKSFKVIPYFPAPELRQFLVSHDKMHYGLDYFKALASFKDKPALDSLSAIYERLHERKSHTLITDMANAIYSENSPLYLDLSLKILAENGKIRIELAESLIKEAPKRAAIAFSEGLKATSQFSLINPRYDFNSEKTLTKVLKLVKKYEPQSISDICSKHMEETAFMQLEVYTDFIGRHKLVNTSQAIFKRLEKENNALEIYHLTQALLSFKDKRHHNQLLPLLRSSQQTWDWGNWSGAFTELFEQYDITLN